LDDKQILERINSLVEEEHGLRGRHQSDGLSEEERERLRSLEASLDQCWDLLRQRRARREHGQDPDATTTRSAQTVEGYLQ
jgi:Protein of unknown function (DUF2630)